MMALSIRPAWAWAIIHGGKDVENRSTRTSFRGRFLVHASLALKLSDFERATQALRAAGERSILPREDEFAVGGFIGSVELADVAEQCDSPWFAPGLHCLDTRGTRGRWSSCPTEAGATGFTCPMISSP